MKWRYFKTSGFMHSWGEAQYKIIECMAMTCMISMPPMYGYLFYSEIKEQIFQSKKQIKKMK